MVTTVVDGDLAEIAKSIWSTLFELTLDPAGASPPDDDSTVTSIVRIDGAWHGAVVFRCPMALAAELTSAMFQAGGEASDDDVRDALGELANMMAGNVKALLPEPCGISLPAVAFGPGDGRDGAGTVPVAVAAFTCAGHPLVITLVRQDAPGSGDRAGPDHTAASTPERRGVDRAGPGTILVIDDSTAIRRILRRALEGAGYSVEEAADGEQGVAACRRVGPNLVLLDVDMPVMDGMAALAAMRADEVMASIPVLFLTALTGGTDVALALDLGAQGYLRKPCEPVELVARVALALRTSERERALAGQAHRAGIASTIDPLTGLGNRRFVEALTTELTTKTGRDAAVGVLFVDVDRFKGINDERGHPVGDSVLRILAGRLAAALGPGAWLARWGGEEFLALVPGQAGAALAALGEQLRASASSTPFAVSPGVLLPVTVSVGCASGTLGAFDVVVGAADAALYEAKRAGRNRVAIGAAS